MKPHRLTVEALGPYAKETEIDFDALAADGIFLIHGPTGAGKTFLFDAMAYALYGALGGTRHDSTLRSDFAERKVVPRVVFEFSVGDTRWRVERNPADDRRVLSGSIKSPKAPKAMLWRLDTDGWRVIAQKPTEVTTELTDMIGLGAKQFHQVIVLPQGKFEQVLRAKTSDRETLLQSLFDTELFERVVDRLDARARETATALDKAQNEAHNLAEQAGQRWRDLTGLPTDFEPHSTPTPAPTSSAPVSVPPSSAMAPGASVPVDPELCDQLAKALATEADRHIARRASLTQALATAQTELLSTDDAAKRWDRRAHTTAEREQLLAAADHIGRRRNQLARGVAAEALRSDLEALGASRQQNRRHRATCEQLLERLAALHRAPASAVELIPAPAADAPSPAADTPATSALASPTETDALTRWIEASLETTTAKLNELSGLTQLMADAKGARAQAEAAASALAELDADLAETRHKQQQVQTHLEPLRTRLSEAMAAATAAANHNEAAQRAEDEAKASAALAQHRQNLARDKEAHQRAERELTERRDAFEALRNAHLDGIAAVLATELQPGDPCMVCGSAEHPAPNVAESETVIHRDELERAEAAATRARHALDGAAKALAQSQARMAELTAAAGAGATDPQVAARQAGQARKVATTTAELAAQLEPTRDRLARAESELETLATRLNQVTGERASTTERVGNEQRKAAELDRSIAERLGPDQNLEASIAHTKKLQTQLRELAGVVRNLDRSQDLTTGLDAAFKRRLGESGLTSENEVAERLISAEERSTLTTAIEAHDQNLARCTSALADPELADLTEHRPDPEPQRQRVAELEAARDDAIANAALYERGATEFKRLASDYRAATAETEAIERTAVVITHLANRCNGRVDPKVSLPRWVLASYLAEICDHANERLDTMTSGRYRLRVEPMKAKGNNKAGLELFIHDAHTGIERPVNTLSGGETFQASLALALGVADVVEAHSGGVQIDALFIDEGFGTLDGEALELAMVELDRLREGGRVVGLISHVAALRDRIQNNLEVIPGAAGSRVRLGTREFV